MLDAPEDLGAAGVQVALQKLVPPVVGALPGMLHLALGVLAL